MIVYGAPIRIGETLVYVASLGPSGAGLIRAVVAGETLTEIAVYNKHGSIEWAPRKAAFVDAKEATDEILFHLECLRKDCIECRLCGDARSAQDITYKRIHRLPACVKCKREG